MREARRPDGRRAGYYQERLGAERLRRCYELAPRRVRQCLRAETNFVLEKIRPGDAVLDLGCGYGRTMRDWARKAGLVVGVDLSRSSLQLGRSYLHGAGKCLLAEMDAARPAFLDGTFDVVACIQNGISAFKRDPLRLLKESLRVTRRNGSVFISTYAEEFWDHRLEWFRRQAGEGLLGEIDEDRTGNGVIVCRDGFRASTFTEADFRRLASRLRVGVEIKEVDRSSLFCILKKA
ncbi:MAG: hypothetical protein A2Y56_05045 [Candidatus Aminicenantes bacterium RBG_13_63_10]|nr:MAG: hypothetical protein A2Y56_05045 [Candidatus Aminicenantes bacterium RBG_13_63_10]